MTNENEKNPNLEKKVRSNTPAHTVCCDWNLQACVRICLNIWWTCLMKLNKIKTKNKQNNKDNSQQVTRARSLHVRRNLRKPIQRSLYWMEIELRQTFFSDYLWYSHKLSKSIWKKNDELWNEEREKHTHECALKFKFKWYYLNSTLSFVSLICFCNVTNEKT